MQLTRRFETAAALEEFAAELSLFAADFDFFQRSYMLGGMVATARFEPFVQPLGEVRLAEIQLRRVDHLAWIGRIRNAALRGDAADEPGVLGINANRYLAAGSTRASSQA